MQACLCLTWSPEAAVRCRRKSKQSWTHPEGEYYLRYAGRTEAVAAEKNWRKHTLQCYTLGLKLFHESCRKTYLNEIDGDDLRRFKVFLRKQQTQTKTVTTPCGHQFVS